MLGKRRWLSLLLAAVVATFGMSLAAGADSATEGQFLAKINSSRAANGLGTLTSDGGLQTHARKHTADMIAADSIYHSTSAELSAAAGSGWTKLAENVGRGNTVDSLHNAFMASAGHKANILGDYNYVGIGTDTAPDGRLYVTVVFMKKGSTPDPTTTTTTVADETPSPTTPTEPKPATTTTTTVPATTTTTMDVPPDKPVTPGESCLEATRFWHLCHD